MFKKIEMSSEFNLSNAVSQETGKKEENQKNRLEISVFSSGTEFIKQIIEGLIIEIKEKNEIQEEAQKILDQVKELIRTEQLPLAQQRLAEQIKDGSEIQGELAEYSVQNSAILDNTRDKVGDIISLIRKVFGQKTAGKFANIAVYLGILFSLKEMVAPRPTEAKALIYQERGKTDTEIWDDEKVERMIEIYTRILKNMDVQYPINNEEFIFKWGALYYKVKWDLRSKLNNEQEKKFALSLEKIDDALFDIYIAKTIGEKYLDLDNKLECKKFEDLKAFGDIIYAKETTEKKENTLNLEIILLGQKHGEDYLSQQSQELIYQSLKALINNHHYKFIGTEKQEATQERFQQLRDLLNSLSRQNSLSPQQAKLKGEIERLLSLAPNRIAVEMGSQQNLIIKNVDPDYKEENQDWKRSQQEIKKITHDFFTTLLSLYNKIDTLGQEDDALRGYLFNLEKQFQDKAVKALNERGQEALVFAVEELLKTGEVKGGVVFGSGDRPFFTAGANQIDFKQIVQKIKNEQGENYFQETYGQEVEDINLNFFIFQPRTRISNIAN